MPPPWLRFREDMDCNILVMDSKGSTGLDLHFVDSIILLEPIKDPALETQVIARAWRVGRDPRRQLRVDLVVMRGTPEEVALEHLEGHRRRARQPQKEMAPQDDDEMERLLRNKARWRFGLIALDLRTDLTIATQFLLSVRRIEDHDIEDC